MKRPLLLVLASAMLFGLAATAWATQLAARCTGKCPLCP